MDNDLPLEIWLILKMQEMDECLTPIMKFFTCLGNPEVYLLVITLIYWSVDRKLGLRLFIFLPVVFSLNSILKQAVHAPRPYWVHPDIQALKPSVGFGWPSGHAQASTVWFYAAIHVKKGWFWLVAIAIAIMVGWSRVHLGVHFPNQVLSGWLFGIVVFLLFNCFADRVVDWFVNKCPVIQILWLFGITLLILIVGWFFVHLLKDWNCKIPPEWINNAKDDLAGTGKSISSSVDFKDIAVGAGGFLGFSLGGLLAHRSGLLNAKGAVWQRLIKGAIGIAIGVALIFIRCRDFNGMSIKPDETRELPHPLLWFFGSLGISLLIIFLLPLLFRRIRLE